MTIIGYGQNYMESDINLRSPHQPSFHAFPHRIKKFLATMMHSVFASLLASCDNEGLHGSLLSPCPQVCGPPLLLLLTAVSASTQFLHGSAILCFVLSCSCSFSHHFVQAPWMSPGSETPKCPSWEQPALLASSWAGVLSWCLLMSALILCASWATSRTFLFISFWGPLVVWEGPGFGVRFQVLGQLQ